MTLTEGKHTGEFVVAEAPGGISREQVVVTVAAETTLAAGSVLGKITATGKYLFRDADAVDGSEVARAVLYGALRNEGVAPADMDGAIIDAVAAVRTADLVWEDPADAATGLPELAARFIKAR